MTIQKTIGGLLEVARLRGYPGLTAMSHSLFNPTSRERPLDVRRRDP
jgi:hypothetical protein